MPAFFFYVTALLFYDCVALLCCIAVPTTPGLVPQALVGFDRPDDYCTSLFVAINIIIIIIIIKILFV